MEKKITKRDIYTAIQKMAMDGNMHIEDFGEGITDETIVEFCANELAILDKKKVAKANTKKDAKADELTETIRGLLTSEPQTIADITAQVNDENATVAKCQYRLNALAKEGFAEKFEVAIENEEGKTKHVVAYAKAELGA
jgi:hypothetical protein